MVVLCLILSGLKRKESLTHATISQSQKDKYCIWFHQYMETIIMRFDLKQHNEILTDKRKKVLSCAEGTINTPTVTATAEKSSQEGNTPELLSKIILSFWMWLWISVGYCGCKEVYQSSAHSELPFLRPLCVVVAPRLLYTQPESTSLKWAKSHYTPFNWCLK